jgi:type II pantothenate kinase
VPARVVATGGGADRLGPTLAGVPVEHVAEFDAWGRGASLVAAAEGVPLPARYLLVSLGTGTSILSVLDGRVERVGGTARGGGTVVGLGRLLVGADSFADVTRLAARGDRRSVDLLVGDVYRGTAASIASQLTAASFAKLDSLAPPDVAHALMGLVAENVVLIAGALARGAGVETIVYCGSTLTENPALRDIVGEITTFFGNRPLFLAGGAYAGAVGAAALAD